MPKKEISKKKVNPAPAGKSGIKKAVLPEEVKKPKVNPALDRGALKSGVKKAVEQAPVGEQPAKVEEELKTAKPATQGDLGEPRPAGRDRYFEAVGRRKTSIARVRLFTKAGDFSVNDMPYGTYFPTLELQKIAEDALQRMKLFGRFRVSVKISGGGIHSQAEALRHGLARCLTKFNPDFRKRLKRAGFLRRDPRMKERKKFGLKKARRAPQWAKR